MAVDREVIIVGGGASGLCAAIICARENKKVLVIEHKERVGKKLLATGNGKCNYTNLKCIEGSYRGEDPEFAEYALTTFGPKESIAFFEELGIYPKEKNGYIYPNSGQASSVVEVLELTAKYLGVEIICKEEIQEIVPGKNSILLKGVLNEYRGKQIILATGGQVSAKLGSDGSGYKLAKQLGHNIIKPVPALIGLKCKEKYYKELAGVRTEAQVSLYIENDKNVVACDEGELQLTNYGISGIPVFQISRFAARAIKERKNVKVHIDFMPGMDGKQLEELIIKRFKMKGRTAQEAMIGLLNKKIVDVLLSESGISLKMDANKIDISQIHKLVNCIKNTYSIVVDTNGFENAQVTAGGVSTKEISEKTMESKLVRGVYMIGELLDIDAICGGYNLQWCWSSAYVAAKAIIGSR